MEIAFGLMVIAEELKMTTSTELVPMILPTVMIPFTLVSVGLSIFATFIAGLFGIQLKLEGPRKLLEVLLKPKVLLTALVLNVLILGGIQGWKWWINYPKLIRTIEAQSDERAIPSSTLYEDVPTVITNFSSSNSSTSSLKISQKWRIDTGKGSFRGAVVSSNRIFTGNDLGIVSELDLSSGKLIRTFYTGTPATTEITIWKNFMYLGEGVHDTHHARIYQFDLTTGAYKKSYQTLGHTEAQPVMGSFEGRDILFSAAGEDGFHAIDPMTMKEIWKVNLGHSDSGALVHNGVVFVGTGREKGNDRKNKSYAAALDFKTGELLWKRELSASSWMRPVIVGENVCYISGEIYFVSERGHITCMNKETGAHTIAHNTVSPIASTPKVLDNSILYVSIRGVICRFDLEEKTDLWCFDTKGRGYSLAGASYDPKRNVVLYPSKKNGLYVLDPSTGELLNQWTPSKDEGEWKSTYADVAVAGDYWIISDNYGSVRAINATDPSQALKN